ncbi:MAG: PaaI family thioesterase [Pseudomonadota bacterium]
MARFTATTQDEIPSLDEIRSMSGLEFMRGILDGRVTGPPIGVLMNYAVDTVEEGRVVFRGSPKFEAQNPMGTVHGGWYGTLLDSCMACAVMTKLPKGALYTTLEYKVNLTRAIPVGMDILADGWTQHVGRSTAVAAGEIRGADDGKLYATGSTACMIMR